MPLRAGGDVEVSCTIQRTAEVQEELTFVLLNTLDRRQTRIEDLVLLNRAKSDLRELSLVRPDHIRIDLSQLHKKNKAQETAHQR